MWAKGCWLLGACFINALLGLHIRLACMPAVLDASAHGRAERPLLCLPLLTVPPLMSTLPTCKRECMYALMR